MSPLSHSALPWYTGVMPDDLLLPLTETPAAAMPVRERIDVMMEEYRALYGLANLRMSALDQRAMLAWGMLLAFWGGFEALGELGQAVLLVGVPILVVLLVRTTINHARSFEDVLRRIEEIERHVNRLAGEPLLQFQSRHPSRGRAIGGRTGRESIRSMMWTGTLLIVSCGWAGFSTLRASVEVDVAVLGVQLACLLMVGVAGWRVRRYRYRKADLERSR